MARRIFRIVIVLSILLGIYIFITKDTHTNVFLITSSSIFFMLFSFGIHGLIAHSLRPKLTENNFAYPLLMGVLWGILLLLFVFFIIPALCPDFFFLNLK